MLSVWEAEAARWQTVSHLGDAALTATLILQALPRD